MRQDSSKHPLRSADDSLRTIESGVPGGNEGYQILELQQLGRGPTWKKVDEGPKEGAEREVWGLTICSLVASARLI